MGRAFTLGHRHCTHALVPASHDAHRQPPYALLIKVVGEPVQGAEGDAEKHGTGAKREKLAKHRLQKGGMRLRFPNSKSHAILDRKHSPNTVAQLTMLLGREPVCSC